jgi:hypothetical protein
VHHLTLRPEAVRVDGHRVVVTGLGLDAGLAGVDATGDDAAAADARALVALVYYALTARWAGESLDGPWISGDAVRPLPAQTDGSGVVPVSTLVPHVDPALDDPVPVDPHRLGAQRQVVHAAPARRLERGRGLTDDGARLLRVDQPARDDLGERGALVRLGDDVRLRAGSQVEAPDVEHPAQARVCDKRGPAGGVERGGSVRAADERDADGAVQDLVVRLPYLRLGEVGRGGLGQPVTVDKNGAGLCGGHLTSSVRVRDGFGASVRSSYGRAVIA